jgi:hypothetical protein
MARSAVSVDASARGSIPSCRTAESYGRLNHCSNQWRHDFDRGEVQLAHDLLHRPEMRIEGLLDSRNRVHPLGSPSVRGSATNGLTEHQGARLRADTPSWWAELHAGRHRRPGMPSCDAS